MVWWQVSRLEVPWEHQQPTAEQNYAYCREAKFHSLTSVAFTCFCFTLRLNLANSFNPINKIINNPVKLLSIWKRHKDHTENNPKHPCLVAKYYICNANKTPPYLQFSGSFDHVIALGFKPLLIKVNKGLCIDFNELWVKTGTYSILPRIQSGKKPPLVRLLPWSFGKSTAWRDHAPLAVQFQPPWVKSPAELVLTVPEFLTLKSPPADFITIIAQQLILHCRESGQENAREQNPDDQSSISLTLSLRGLFSPEIYT